jgi:hypothetical protein
MTHRIVLRSVSAWAATLLLLSISATAQAQLFRAYLAPGGNDANACTLAAPCRLLPAALAAVADGGEIWMLDSANYNTAPVNITKSVTILAVPGAVGSVLATGGDAIDIATAGVKVVLRNLVIVPQPGGGGVNGINMSAGASLTVDKCVIANLAAPGILVRTTAVVRITDTTIRNNLGHGLLLQDGVRATVTRATIGGNTGDGIHVYGPAFGFTTTVDVTDSTLDGNANGIAALSVNTNAVLKVSVRGSRLVRNTGAGATTLSSVGAAVTLSVSNNIVSNNAFGILAFSAGTRVWASGNTISDNGTGLYNSLALLESTGNNAVRNNGADTSGDPIVVVAPK